MWGRAVVVVGEGLWLLVVGVGVMVRVQLLGGRHPLLLLLLHRVMVVVRVVMLLMEIRRRRRHVGERLHVVLAHRRRESAVEAGRGGEWWRGIRRRRRRRCERRRKDGGVGGRRGRGWSSRGGGWRWCRREKLLFLVGVGRRGVQDHIVLVVHGRLFGRCDGSLLLLLLLGQKGVRKLLRRLV